MESRSKALAHLRKGLREKKVGEMPLEKVTVAASSPEALKKGLEKAEEIVEDPKKMLGAMGSEMGEDEGYESEEESEEDEMEDEMEDADKEMMKQSCSDDMIASMSREELMDKVKKLREML